MAGTSERAQDFVPSTPQGNLFAFIKLCDVLCEIYHGLPLSPGRIIPPGLLFCGNPKTMSNILHQFMLHDA